MGMIYIAIDSRLHNSIGEKEGDVEYGTDRQCKRVPPTQGHQNPITGSKVTAVLLNGLI